MCLNLHHLHKISHIRYQNYLTNNLIIIFSPDSDIELVNLLKKNNFQTILLASSNYKSWQLSNDSHWSCYGHEEAAKQVSKYLIQGTWP